MAKNLTHQGRHLANRLLVFQAFLTIVCSLVFLLMDFKAGYSAFLGGLTCLLPNYVFVTYAYRFGGARAAKKIASSFYKGETLKILITALMFAVIFMFVPIAIGPMMTTYVLGLMVYWMIPVFSK